MTIQFGYNKKQVLDGLRGHFFGQPEIRIIVIVINLFAILSAILLFFKKIRVPYFLLFSFLWFFVWLSIRRFLPLSIYRRNTTFRDHFTLSMDDQGVLLETTRGSQQWKWENISTFKETAYFFHLYFTARSFFLIPKDSFKDITEIQSARQLLKSRIKS